MGTFIDVLVKAGQLLHHVRGAWRCTCEIAVIVNSTISTDLDPDPGF